MSEQEQASQEEVVAPVQDQEEAAMQAAIAESRGQEPPESPEPEPEPEPQPEEEPPAPQTILAGMTEEQVKDLLVKAGKVDQLEAQVRNVFGRFGEMNSRIQQLQKPVQQPVANAKELAGQYHEALLEGDVEKANELFVQMRQAGAEPATPGTDLTEVLTKQDQKLEERFLRMRHPDWEAVTKTNDFALWTQTLPEQDRTTLNTTWDAQYIAEKLDAFKAAKEKPAEPAQADQQRQQLTRRLENAVTPQGSARAAPPVVTEEEAMQAAIRARIRPRAT